jgi:hypothetical protein
MTVLPSRGKCFEGPMAYERINGELDPIRDYFVIEGWKRREKQRRRRKEVKSILY